MNECKPLLGGGGARSALWVQTLADVLGRPIAAAADVDLVAARGWGCAAGAFQYLGLWGGYGDGQGLTLVHFSA